MKILETQFLFLKIRDICVKTPYTFCRPKKTKCFLSGEKVGEEKTYFFFSFSFFFLPLIKQFLCAYQHKCLMKSISLNNFKANRTTNLLSTGYKCSSRGTKISANEKFRRIWNHPKQRPIVFSINDGRLLS